MKKNDVFKKLLQSLKKKNVVILFLIVLLSVFFRGYNSIPQFDFTHDGDLYSWIAKDMIQNHHFRLIGQETSTKGIFIGGGLVLCYFAVFYSL